LWLRLRSGRELDEGVELVRQIGQPRLRELLLGFREEGLPCGVVQTLLRLLYQGLASLGNRYGKGRPRKFDEQTRRRIVDAVCTPPYQLKLPFSVWSLPKLRDYLIQKRIVSSVAIETLRRLLREEGVSLQRTKTWKQSTDPNYAAKKKRSSIATDKRKLPAASAICPDAKRRGRGRGSTNILKLRPHIKPVSGFTPSSSCKEDLPMSHRFILFTSAILFLVARIPEAFADGWHDPCTYHHVGQPFGGGDNHLGVDLCFNAACDAGIGTPVYAIADGVVELYSAAAGCYGGWCAPCTNCRGAVLFIKHQNSDGDYIIAQYGHLQNVTVTDDASVCFGQQIAEIAEYSPCRDGSQSCPHLHFGIWNGTDMPNDHWGYGPQLSWVDPLEYMNTHDPLHEGNMALTTLWHPSGSLVRTQSNPAVYQLMGVVRHPFMSEDDFFSNRYTWNDVIFISDQEMTGYCGIGDSVRNRTGETLFRISDSDNPTRVWMKHKPQGSSDSVRTPMLTRGILESYGFQWGTWQDVSSSHELAQLPSIQPLNYREGSLVKGSETAVYVMDQGYLRPIQNEEVFEQLGYCWGDIITVSQSDIASSTGCLGIDSAHPVTQSVILTPPNCSDPIQPQVSVSYEGQASRVVHLDWSIVDNLSLYSLLLDFSPNAWITHSLITGNLLGLSRTESASGQFDWQLPDDVSGTTTVRAVGLDQAGNVAFEYTQDFLIDPPAEGVHVTGPNYGQVWTCSGLAVQWTTSGYMTTMRIELNRSYPEGLWETLSYNEANDGFYAWLITGPSTQRGRFRVTSNFDPNIWDVSDANLTIVAPDITYPNGGEVFVAGNGVYPITWNPEALSQYMISIDLNRSYPNGQWEPIELLTPNDGETTWWVTGPATAQARVRIYGGDGWCIYDWSDANFTIIAPQLDLVSPTGDDTLLAGVPFNVIWSTSDLPGDVQITLDYYNSCCGGGTQVLSEYAANDGSELCIIQNPWGYEMPLAVDAWIEIRSLYYPGIYTESDDEFVFLTPVLSLEAPWPTDTWNVGQTHTITWYSWYVNVPVMIELNRDFPNGPWETLTSNTENDGLFAWTVTPPASENARVRISTISYPLVADTTDGDFVITDILPSGLLWERAYGGSNLDICNAVDQTPDGGFVLAGLSYRTGNYHAWLVKTDRDGDTLWTKQFYTDYYDEARSVQATPDGGLIVCGHRRYRMWVARLNADGDILWTKQHGPPSEAVAYSVSVLDDGYALAGTSNAGIMLMRLNPLGDTLWTRAYPGQSFNDAVSMTPTIDGGYALAECIGYQDIFVVKTDSVGNVLWSRTIGSSNPDYGMCIQQTADGGYIVAGVYDSRMALLKLSADGDSVWMHTYGAYFGNDSKGYGVTQTFDGGYIATGRNFVPGNYQLYLVRTNSVGDTLWTRDLGSSNDDEGRSILQLTTGEFVVAGLTFSFGAGERDYYLLKLASDIQCNDWTPSPPQVVIRHEGGLLHLHWSPIESSVAGCPEVISCYEVLSSSSVDGPFTIIGRTTGASTSFTDPDGTTLDSVRFYLVRAIVGSRH